MSNYVLNNTDHNIQQIYHVQMLPNSFFFFECVLQIFFFLFKNFLAALGLCCCARAFFSCGKWGLLFIAVRRLLIALASLVVEHGLQAHRLQQLWHVGSVVVTYGLSSCGVRAVERRLSSCGARAQLLRGMWDLPGPGVEPLSPA